MKQHVLIVEDARMFFYLSICRTRPTVNFTMFPAVANITVSIGACASIHDSLDATLSIADTCLYRAKGQGRNMVVIE